MSHAANHDDLTGIPNRRKMNSDFENADFDRLSGICIVDLDGFKEVNDLLGHAAGDEVLVAISKRMQSFCAGKGRMYRIGGDEFLIASTYPFFPEDIAHLLRISLTYPVKLSDHFLSQEDHMYAPLSDVSVLMSASLGLSSIGDGVTQAKLLSIADAALYKAKRERSFPILLNGGEEIALRSSSSSLGRARPSLDLS